MDRALLSGNLSSCKVAAIEFTGQQCVATTGSMTPDYDLLGNQIQYLSNQNNLIEWLSISIDITTTGCAVVLCWLDGATKAETFVKSLFMQPKNLIESMLPQLIFFYLENTYFSEAWWNQLSLIDQIHIRRLALNENPYYDPDLFVEKALLPWSIKAIHKYG